MIQINEKLKKSIGTKDVDFSEYVGHMLKPKFSGSELTGYVQKKLGHLPKWLVSFSVGTDEDGVLKFVNISGGIDQSQEDLYYYLRDCKPNVEEDLPQVVLEWFKEKGFPDNEKDPEGFVKRLVQLYPEISDFVEIN